MNAHPASPAPHDAQHPLPDGRALALLPEKAAWLADAGLLLVADVHFGKAASFRRLGVPVPQGTTAGNLDRLDALLARLPVRQLVFLGDFLHAATGRAEATLQALADWRARHAGLAITLVRGNHDDRAGDPPAGLCIDSVTEPWRCAGLDLCHDPAIGAATDAYAVAGHLHPTLRLGRGFDSVRLPCFHAGPRCLVLPAFGEFTGGWPVTSAAADRLYVVADQQVLAVAAAGKRRSASP